MKPNTVQVVFRDTVGTLEDLKIFIAKVESVTGRADTFLVNINGNPEVILERECLSDGSIAYNLEVRQ